VALLAFIWTAQEMEDRAAVAGRLTYPSRISLPQTIASPSDRRKLHILIALANPPQPSTSSPSPSQSWSEKSWLLQLRTFYHLLDYFVIFSNLRADIAKRITPVID
jgi:hypothetical protein